MLASAVVWRGVVLPFAPCGDRRPSYLAALRMQGEARTRSATCHPEAVASATWQSSAR